MSKRKPKRVATGKVKSGCASVNGSAYGLRVIGCNWPLQEMYAHKDRAERARQNALYTPQQLELVKISWRTVK